MCVTVINLFLLVFLFIDPENWGSAFCSFEQYCCDHSYNCLLVQRDAFFPIHCYDQIDTKMDLFLMKLLLIKSPRTPWQCWGRRPGARGVLAALRRGEEDTLTLGWRSPPGKGAGILSWAHSCGKVLGLLISPNLALLFASSCRPWPPTLPGWLPFPRHMPILQDLSPLHSKCSVILVQG